MKAGIKLVLKIVAWTTGIFLVFWILLLAYVSANKKTLISKVTAELKSRVKAEVNISDFETSLISTFPHISLRITDISLRDTMWATHHHDLLQAHTVLVRLGFFSLFSGTPEIKKVIVQKGSVYVFSDTTGYSNTYMFTSRDTAGSAGKRRLAVPDVELENMRITLDLRARSKLYDFDIHRFNCQVTEKGDHLKLNVRTDMLIHSLAFNADSGSFVQEKPVEGAFGADFYAAGRKLQFEDVRLKIGDHPFSLSGMFDLAGGPPLYYLDIRTEDLGYKEAASLVSRNLTRKLVRFNVDRPMDIHAILDGTRRPNKIPTVNIEVQVKKSTATTPTLTLTDVSFSARFSNRLDSAQRPVNNNSGFTFRDFSGKWHGVPFHSKLATLNDLDHPIIKGDVSSDLNLKDVNNLIGSNALEFGKGKGQVNLTYRGPIMPGDTAAVSIHGNVHLSDAEIRYIPRNLVFSRSSGNINFAGNDVYVKDLKTTAANSVLVMNGSAKNMVSLLGTNPDKITLDWTIASSKLNLGDFLAFLGKRTTRTKSSGKNISTVIRQLDRMLEACNVNLKLDAARLTYKKFDASNVAALVGLTNELITLKKVSIQHAGGSMSLNGSLAERGSGNWMTLNTHMTNVNIPVIFQSFDNFGQDGIMDKNLKGKLDADLQLSGFITENAGVETNSLKGDIDFNLKDGELIDFEPIRKITAAALNSEGVSSVRFADLRNRIDLNGSQVKVNRMEIRSSAFTMFLEGLYDLKKGTDLSIQIPLNNLTKSKSAFTLENKGIDSKTGVSLWLRAKTADDGRAKISWDPFKKGVKERKKNSEDSLQTAVPDSIKLEKNE